MNKRDYVSIGVIIVLAIFVFRGCSKELEAEQYKVLNEHLEDSVKHTINKYGEAQATISLLQGENAEMLLEQKSTDKTVKWLQEELTKYKSNVKNGGTVGVIGTVTTFSGTTTTTVSFSPVIDGKRDTLPTYKTVGKDSTWIKYSITANADSTHLDLQVKNKYTIVIGEEKTKVEGKLFKRNKPVAFVINKNPYTQVTEMKVYEVTNKVKKRISLNVSAGYCVPLFSFKPQPYIGVGVGYNILNLW